MVRAMKFELQFPASEIAYWVRKYRNDEHEMVREAAAFEAGKHIARRAATLSDLEIIARWKSRRRIALLRENEPADIAEACQIASKTSSVVCAVAVLQGLRGVHVRMASAILTTMNPGRFTVIDVRALEALDQSVTEYTLQFYVAYLAACRRIADTNNVTLRELDQALWAWSKCRQAQRGRRRPRPSSRR